MYNFDETNGILFAGRLDNRFKDIPRKKSDQRVAFEKYINDTSSGDNDNPTLAGDLRMLSEEVESYIIRDNLVADPTFKIIPTKYIYDNKSAKGNYENYRITTVFGYIQAQGDRYRSKEFELFNIPEPDDKGTILYDGKEYAIFAKSEPSKYITFEQGKQLSIMMHASKCAIDATTDLLKTKISIGSIKCNLITMAYIAANVQTLIKIKPDEFSDLKLIESVYSKDIPDVNAELAKLCLPSAVQWRDVNKDLLDFYSVYSNDPARYNEILKSRLQLLGAFGYCQYSHNEISPYDLKDVRRQLNELLSIDRGLGQIISRDIYSPTSGELLIEKGRQVTEEVIDTLNYEHINNYFITVQPDMVDNAILAMNVGVLRIPAGVYVSKQLQEYNWHVQLPVNNRNITTKDITFEESALFVIPEDFKVDATVYSFINAVDLCDYQVEALRFNGTMQTFPKRNVYGDILESTVKNTVVPVKINPNKPGVPKNCNYTITEEEIIGNRHFLVDGRWEYCSSVTGEVTTPSKYLTTWDLIALISLAPRLAGRLYENKVVDRDYGMRKNFTLYDSHLHQAFKKAVKSIAISYYSTYRNYIGVSKEIEVDTLNGNNSYKWINALFDNELGALALVDKTNPLAYQSFINRVISKTKNAKSTSTKMRSLAMGFYGRICPYETPASGKLGLTNTKAIHATIKGGVIYTEYYAVHYNAQTDTLKIDFSKKIPMTVTEEEDFIIADLLSLEFDKDGVISTRGRVTARVPSNNTLEKHVVENIDVRYVEYVNCYPDQTLSPTATTIPFIGSNDPTRVSYGLSMARQTRPLLYREHPLVMTNGFYNIPRYNDMFMITAEDNGTIIDVQYTNTSYAVSKRATADIFVQYDNPVTNVGVDMASKCTKLYRVVLAEYSYSSVILRYVKVQKGQRVKKGQVLVESNFTKDGLLATGVNALIAEIPVGYNYEDGVFMSETFSHKLTSYGHTDDTVQLFKGEIPVQDKLIQYIDSNSTPYCHIKNNATRSSRNVCSDDLRGYIVQSSRVAKGDGVDAPKLLKTDALSINPLNEGDKIANRHGNKGVTPKVIQNSDSLYLENGELIDIAFNPLGVVSRMNIGQIKEIHIGLACKVLGIKFCVQPFNEPAWDECIMLLSYAYVAANQGVDAANRDPRFKMFPESMKRYVKEREDFVRNWEGVFDENGCAYIYNPRTGKKTHKKVLIGYSYIYKLVQEVEEKINARGGYLSEEKYVAKYAKPTRGAKEGGGQSMGRMELDAYSAHGCKHYIQELLHRRGDNLYARQAHMMRLLGTEENVYYEDIEEMMSVSERRAVEYLKAILQATGITFDVEGEIENLVGNDIEVLRKKFFFSERAVLGKVKAKIETKEEQEYKLKVAKEQFDAVAALDMEDD